MIQAEDVVRDKRGNWNLYRVKAVYSTMFICVSVSVHKHHKPGKQELFFMKDFQVETNPYAFAMKHGFTIQEDS